MNICSNFHSHWTTFGWDITKKLMQCFYETQCRSMINTHCLLTVRYLDETDPFTKPYIDMMNNTTARLADIIANTMNAVIYSKYHKHKKYFRLRPYSSRVIFWAIFQDLSSRSFCLHRISASDPPLWNSFESPSLQIRVWGRSMVCVHT